MPRLRLATKCASALVSAAFVASAMLVTPLAAQCELRGTAGLGIPGVGSAPLSGSSGEVHAAIPWDPDGPGPAGWLWIFGGSFQVAGNALASNLAAYDVQTGAWSEVGGGVSGIVMALEVGARGELIVGGQISRVGGMPVYNIAAWDGRSWFQLGNGADGIVRQIEQLSTGGLIVGGTFTRSWRFPSDNLARWNGTTWSEVGVGTNKLLGTTHVIEDLGGGSFLVGGNFSSVGGVPGTLARWSPQTGWSTYGPNPPATVTAIDTMPNGDLLVGTSWGFAFNSMLTSVLRWDGITWDALGDAMDLPIRRLLPDGFGSYYAIGSFNRSGIVGMRKVAHWSGSAWTQLGGGLVARHVNTGFSLPTGELVIGGRFSVAGSRSAYSVAYWSGSSWSPLHAGIDGVVEAFATLPSGELVVGGEFTELEGRPISYIARRTSTGWQPLGGGTGESVAALEVLSGGDLVACTDSWPLYENAQVQRWNGNSWSFLGSGTDAPIHHALALSNDRLVVAGDFTVIDALPARRIALWNGSSWQALGLGLDGFVWGMAELPNGDLVVIGRFATAGNVAAPGIARWNGTVWSAFPVGWPAPFDMYAIARLRSGDLVASVVSSVGYHLSRWQGGAWQQVGGLFDAAPTSIAELPNGDLVAAGGFQSAGGIACNGLARWNGARWIPVDGGVVGTISELHVVSSGELWAGGNFSSIGGRVSSYFGRFEPSCAATVRATGASCSTGGQDLLRVESMPWIGTTCRARAMGLPASSVAFGMVGLTPVAFPISTVFPQGGPGCDFLTLPEFLQPLTIANGSAAFELVLPRDLALVGVELHQQVLRFELAGGGALRTITSTNAFALRIGHF